MSEEKTSTTPATSWSLSAAPPPPTAPPPAPLTIRIGGAAKTQRVMAQFQKQQQSAAPVNFLISSGATKRAASGNAITKMAPAAQDDRSTAATTPSPPPDHPAMTFSAPSTYSSAPIPAPRRPQSLSAAPFGRSHHQHNQHQQQFNRHQHRQERHLQPHLGHSAEDADDDDTTPLIVVGGDGGYGDEDLEESAIGGQESGGVDSYSRSGPQAKIGKCQDSSEAASIAAGGESAESKSTDIQTRTSEFLAALERCESVRECICEFVNFATVYFKFAVGTYVNDRGTPGHADDVCDVIGVNVPVNGNANQIYEMLLDCVCDNIRKKNSILSSGAGWKPTERVVTINKASFLLFQLKDANVAVVVAREANDCVSGFRPFHAAPPGPTSDGEWRGSAAPSSAAYAMALGYLMTARGAMHKRIMQLQGFEVYSNDSDGRRKSATSQDGLSSPRAGEDGTASTAGDSGGAGERDRRCVLM